MKPIHPARLASALLLLLPLVACTGSGSPRTQPPAGDFLDEHAMLLLMEDREQLDPDGVALALVAGLRPGGDELRRRTALTLGRIGDPRGAATLAALLEDASAPVRRAAIFALGELAEDGHRGAAERILLSLVDPDHEVGRLAVEAAAKAAIPLEQVASRLIAAPSQELLPRLLPSLFRFDSPGLVRWAEAGLETSDPTLRAAAAFALGRSARPEGAPVLRRLLGDGDPFVRSWAARGLGRCGGPADLALLLPLIEPQPAREAEGPVVQAVRSARRLVAAGARDGAAIEAATLAALKARMLPLLASTRPAVRIAALEEIVVFLPDEPLALRLQELSLSSSPRERELALLALAEAGDPRARPILGRLMEDPEKSVRASAARAAAFLLEWDVLTLLAADADPHVRRTVLETRLLDEKQALPAVDGALPDPDFSVRSTALDWLVEHPQPELGRLAAAFGRAREDRSGDADALISAVKALAAHAKKKEDDHDAVVALLETVAKRSDFLVRRTARQLLSDLGETPPELSAASDKGLDAYRQLHLLTRKNRFAEMRTEKGNVRFEIECPDTPRTCHQFFQLVGQGFYDRLRFHRIVPDFVVQTGDPRGDGVGGPGYALRDEVSPRRYGQGVIGLADSGPDTAGSQFFITLSPQPHLEGRYVIFGRVVAGFEVLQELVQGDTLLAIVEVP